MSDSIIYSSYSFYEERINLGLMVFRDEEGLHILETQQVSQNIRVRRVLPDRIARMCALKIILHTEFLFKPVESVMHDILLGII